MKKVLLIFALVIFALAAILGWNVMRWQPVQYPVESPVKIDLDASALAQHLAQALAIPSISHQDSSAFDPEPFLQLQRYIAATYPQIHSRLRRQIINGYSLLYTWPGSDPQAPPLLLLAHQDVVPVETASKAQWKYPPFAGAIGDGYIWGRGAMDDKASLIAILESVEYLLRRGFQPRQTVYLAFGHDEEIGGQAGAKAIAKHLQQQGIRPALVLDEGGLVADGLINGLQKPAALIGVAEKGYMSVELVVQGRGGHSSMPPVQTPVGILARALARLEENQMPAELASPVREMFLALGPELPFMHRLVLSNLWLFEPLLERMLVANPSTAAIIRTTTAPTMLEGSAKENVLPARARAVVNFRIRPGDTHATVLAHVQHTIDDPRVAVNPLRGWSDPSPISDMNATAYHLLNRTIREVFPDVPTAPMLVVGATDARHYSDLSRNVYRFLPIKVRDEDVQRVHGLNERIGVADFATAAAFYIRLLQNAEKI